MAELDTGMLSMAINGNFNHIANADVLEAQRNIKSVNGILEAGLANNLVKLQTMGIGEAAALNSVIRADVTPQLVAIGAAVSALRDLVRTAQPAN